MKDEKNIIESIRELAAGDQPDLDSTALAELAKLLFEHKCFYLLSLIKAPHPYSRHLHTHALFNHICIQERYLGCRPVFRDLEAAGIPYAVIKGAVLSTSAFGSPYSRSSGDIDLLISRHHVDTVKQIMTDNGFVQGRVTKEGIKPFTRSELLFQSAMSHQTAPFVKATGNRICPYIEVDINMDIFWGESTQKADMSFVLTHTVQTSVCDVTVRKLLPEMELISLCLHHYKDMNSLYLLSHGSLSLKLFCDIYFYCINANLNPEKLYILCDQLGVSKYVYYCLYYTDYLFNDPALQAHCHALSCPQAQALLNTFGLAANEIQQWDIPFPERLFSTDIRAHFRSILSEELLGKIRTNERYM